jgi:site-specific recombinase XerD
MRQILQPAPTREVAWLNEFVTDLEQADLSARTVASYRDDLERFLHWFQQTKDAEVRLERLQIILLIARN